MQGSDLDVLNRLMQAIRKLVKDLHPGEVTVTITIVVDERKVVIPFNLEKLQ